MKKQTKAKRAESTVAPKAPLPLADQTSKESSPEDGVVRGGATGAAIGGLVGGAGGAAIGGVFGLIGGALGGDEKKSRW
jgi:hypothetical protein